MQVPPLTMFGLVLSLFLLLRPDIKEARVDIQNLEAQRWTKSWIPWRPV